MTVAAANLPYSAPESNISTIGAVLRCSIRKKFNIVRDIRPNLYSASYHIFLVVVVGNGALAIRFSDHKSMSTFFKGIRFPRELELELIQTHMIQKPMLQVEVCTRALRASQNVRKKRDACLVCSLCLSGYMGVFSGGVGWLAFFVWRSTSLWTLLVLSCTL